MGRSGRVLLILICAPSLVIPELSPALAAVTGHVRVAPERPASRETQEVRAARPRAIDENLDTFHAVFTLFPTAEGDVDRGPGLRSVVLHQGLRFEPHARWPNGEPHGADARLSPAAVRATLEAFGDFWSRAQRYHSSRRTLSTTPAPAGSLPAPAARLPEPGLQIQLVVHDDNFHHHFVRNYTLVEGAQVLSLLERTVDAPGARLLLELRAQLGR